MKIEPSGVCTDAEFIRRIQLDLTGLPPTADQVKAFLSDKTPSRQKRDALVDKLVGNEDYIDHWTNKWADLLQVNRKFLGTEVPSLSETGFVTKLPVIHPTMNLYAKSSLPPVPTK